MSHSRQVHLVPDEISIIDWYDGAIRGIVKSKDHYFLFLLVAWDPDSQRRAYVVVNLDYATADEMIKLCNAAAEPEGEEKWSQLDQLYDQYLANYKDSAYLLNEEPLATKSFTLTPIPLDNIAELQGFGIEKTLNPKTQTLWFSMR